MAAASEADFALNVDDSLVAGVLGREAAAMLGAFLGLPKAASKLVARRAGGALGAGGFADASGVSFGSSRTGAGAAALAATSCAPIV